jgi:hypothetical protein
MVTTGGRVNRGRDCPLAIKPASTPRRLSLKKTLRDFLPIHTLVSTVSALVLALPSSEVLVELMNYPMYCEGRQNACFFNVKTCAVYCYHRALQG